MLRRAVPSCQEVYIIGICISITLTALGVLFIVTDVLILRAALNFPLSSVALAGDFTTFQTLSIVSAVLAGIFSILCVPLLFLSCWVGIFNDSADERSGECCYGYLVLRVGSIANLLVQCILFSLGAAKLSSPWRSSEPLRLSKSCLINPLFIRWHTACSW